MFVTLFDFNTVTHCDQLIVGPTHAHVGTLYLLMSDVPVLVRVAVLSPIDGSDTLISMAQAVPYQYDIRTLFLKHQVHWNTVYGAIQNLTWLNSWTSDNSLAVLNEHLSLLLECYVPTKVIRMHNKDKPCFDDQFKNAFYDY